MLHPEHYPHIFDELAAYSSPGTLRSLRAVSKAAAESADAFLFENATILLDWEGRVFLQSNAGARLLDDLRAPSALTEARLRRILPRIRQLVIAGAFEFGCIPSHSLVSRMVARMYALEHVSLVPDPYGRQWPGNGGLVLDVEGSQGCEVRRIARPPTPPISSPYRMMEADTADLVIRRHSGSDFDPAVLSILGRAVEITLVLSLWSPGWTTSPAHRTAAVSAPDHTSLVEWRYSAACAFAAGAMEPRLAASQHRRPGQDKTSAACDQPSFGSQLDETPIQRDITVVGLEQVHPAYLDHGWMPDYETISRFREGVRGQLESMWDGVAGTDGIEDPQELGSAEREPFHTRHDDSARDRPRGRFPPTPPLDNVHEGSGDERASTSTPIDTSYLSHALDRLTDYESRSPSPSPSRMEAARRRLAVSASPSRLGQSSSPPPENLRVSYRQTPSDLGHSRTPSRSPSTHSSLYSHIKFVTQLQYGHSALPASAKANTSICDPHGQGQWQG